MKNQNLIHYIIIKKLYHRLTDQLVVVLLQLQSLGPKKHKSRLNY